MRVLHSDLPRGREGDAEMHPEAALPKSHPWTGLYVAAGWL
jgi:hypothetical protein